MCSEGSAAILGFCSSLKALPLGIFVLLKAALSSPKTKPGGKFGRNPCTGVLWARNGVPWQRCAPGEGILLLLWSPGSLWSSSDLGVCKQYQCTAECFLCKEPNRAPSSSQCHGSSALLGSCRSLQPQHQLLVGFPFPFPRVVLLHVVFGSRYHFLFHDGVVH